MKSPFFRRLLLVMVMVVTLTSIAMAIGNGLLSRRLYVDIKLDEMLPKAETVANLVMERQRGEITYDAFERVILSCSNESDAMIVLFDGSGDAIMVNNLPDNVEFEAVKEQLIDQVNTILSGGMVKDSSHSLEDAGVMLVAGTPIKGRNGSILGGVMMIQMAVVATAALKPLRMLLYSCVVASVIVMLVTMIWQVKRATNPLHKMSQVAIDMSRGNFDVRASENESGEIGLLARALNTLCENLSSTIYQLRFEKGQLDELLQSLSDGVAAMDGSGELTHYNSALMRMFGVVNVEKREDLIKDPMVWKAFDEVFLTGESQTLTYPASGDRVLWITVSPVNTEDGNRTGVVGLFKDMTEMERTERMRREYVANVSHELRTPLTAVRGLLEPLADGMVRDEADRQRYYKIMLHEVERLSRLITDMLALSRLQSGTDYMELSRVDLKELISDIAMGYSSAASQKGINLEVDCADVSDALTDADRIEQVLVILLDNAMRYTPEGGTVKISLRSGNKLLVSVEDNGCGIPEKDIPHIFERFYKVDKSRGDGGTGLGLSIAKHVMDKLGEDITVNSELGKGTCFTFTVKRYVSNAIELGPASEKNAKPKGTQPAKAEHKEAGKVYDADYEVVPEVPEEKSKAPKKKLSAIKKIRKDQ